MLGFLKVTGGGSPVYRGLPIRFKTRAPDRARSHLTQGARVTSDLVASGTVRTFPLEGDVLDLRDVPDRGCVICGDRAPEPGACCSSRCAGEAQR